jgi:murein DD-endopeptidase MepM/ murein hydrolase activator NlpD
MSTRTPAINGQTTRRAPRPSLFTWVAVAAAAVLGGASIVSAEVDSIGGAATAGSTAERIEVTPPGLFFPIDPVPRCDVLNNFAGMSKQYGSGRHQGVDIGAGLGQAVYAVEDGVLERQFTDLSSAAGYGWAIKSVTDTQYRYYHLSAFAEGVALGDDVARGDLIGYVGDTGNATPGGYHLHFEVRPGPEHDTPVDPVPLLAIPSSCRLYPKQ